MKSVYVLISCIDMCRSIVNILNVNLSSFQQRNNTIGIYSGKKFYSLVHSKRSYTF